MSGTVQAGPPRIEVRVDLANRGDATARGVTLEAELLGQHGQARLDDAPPGAAGSALFAFDVGAAPPGVHALALHLQYARSTAAGDTASQRGYLLLALGANPGPAVRVGAPTSGSAPPPDRGAPESADARLHQVRIRVLAPRGLQPLGPSPTVVVPAKGAVTVEARLLRGGAPRPSRQGVVLLAETVGEAEANASAATVVVDVQADPALLPRLRWPLTALAVLLLAASGYAEYRGRRRGRRGGNGEAETAETRREGGREVIRVSLSRMPRGRSSASRAPWPGGRCTGRAPISWGAPSSTAARRPPRRSSSASSRAGPSTRCS